MLTGAACGGAPPATSTPAAVVVTATPEAKPAATTAASAAPTASPAAAAKTGDSIKPSTGGTPSAQPTSEAAIKPTADINPAAIPGKTSGKSEVSALWFSQGPQGYSGGTSKVVVSVEKNTSRELRVGFYEQEVGGSGPMWRAAGWMAVIMSGLLLGIDPADYRYTYDVGGNVDGPSAGALMTVATIATVLGHAVKADAAMTGTINPDGTVGPVGGIPQKIDGAAAAKKKLVLIPAGKRQSMDLATKQSVDVVDRGRRLGVEVREVSDIYEAYELMTGSPLPKPVGMRETRPALPGASFERTRAKAKEWYTRYWQLQGQYQALPNTYKFDMTDAMMVEAGKAGDKADSFYQQGLPSAAYNRAFTATLYASISYHTAKVIESFLTGGIDSGVKYLQSMKSVSLKIDGFIDRLETQKATTLGDVVAISDAYGNVTVAMGLISLGDAAVAREVKTQEEVIGKLTEATLLYALADHLVELAKDSIDVGMGFGKAPAPSVEKIESLAELFRRAADANLNYFDSIVLNQIAQGAGMHPDVIKARFSQHDFTYTFANSSRQALELLKRRSGSQLPGAYATLGGALQSYVMSSVLVAKYYSLSAEVDQNGAIVGVQEGAMINMLDFAEKRSKELIGLSVNIGGEPVQPVIAYEGAKINREGDLDSKFNALSGFWYSSLSGQIMGTLSGKAAIVR
jgi:hypothetical protein